MLRDQSVTTDPLTFLAGQSDMARRMRAYDWSSHPLGSPESWPQSLRSALSICLHSAFPTALYWGAELRLLYNDAWGPIPGPRHPAALGKPAREVWYDIWHIIEPQLQRVIATGEGVFVEDQLLPMRRYGVLEETYWNYSLTAIRGEDGRIVGVFNTGHETTRNVLARRKMAFLLELNEALRVATDLASARSDALKFLGRHLKADRVGVRYMDLETNRLQLRDVWSAPGVADIDQRIQFDQLGRSVTEDVTAGGVMSIENASQDARLLDAHEVFRSMDVEAALIVPWVQDGEVTAVLFVHSRWPRRWTDVDVDTVREVLERLIGWAESERIAERERTMMREIDHRAKNELAVVQSVVRLTTADDIDTFRKKVNDRIRALARAHELLTERRWQTVELRTLITEELAPYAADVEPRIDIDGPPVRLTAERTQMFALLLHELTTNAAKYGAFATATGRLRVRWSMDGNGMLELSWEEMLPMLEEGQSGAHAATASGAPQGSAFANGGKSPAIRGFGSELLESVVERQMGGRLSRTYAESGLVCSMTVPLGHGSHSVATSALAPRANQPSTGQSNTAIKGGANILIVEDEPLIAMELANVVEAFGHAVFASAHSVDEGLRVLATGRPDVAIVDANLAGQSSRAVVEALIRLDVPVIYASGYSELDDVPDTLRDTPRLLKPISSSDLEKAIASVYGQSGTGQPHISW